MSCPFLPIQILATSFLHPDTQWVSTRFCQGWSLCCRDQGWNTTTTEYIALSPTAHHTLWVTKNIFSVIPPSLSTQVYCKSGKGVGRGELCQLLLLLARPSQFHPKGGQTTSISVIWKLVKLATYGHYLGFSKSESWRLGRGRCVEPRNVSFNKIIKSPVIY